MDVIGFIRTRTVLGPIHDETVEYMRATELIDQRLVAPEGLRIMMSYPDETVLVKFIERCLRVHPESTLRIAAEFPDIVSHLLSHWEDHSGIDSALYLYVLLRVSDLTQSPVLVSGMLTRVFNDANRIQALAHAVFFHGAQICAWADLTEEARITILDFWSTHDDAVSVVLSRIALSPVNTEYCEVLRDARGVIDSISDESLKNSATRYLIVKCPHLRSQRTRSRPSRQIE